MRESCSTNKNRKNLHFENEPADNLRRMSAEELPFPSSQSPNNHEYDLEVRKYVFQGWQGIVQNDWEGARTSFEQGIVVAQQCEDRLGRAHCTNGLGCVDHCLGNYAEALAHFHGALVVFREFQDDQQYASVTGNIANIYFAQYLYEEAEARYRQITLLGEDVVGVQNYLTSLLNISNCLLRQEKAEKIQKNEEAEEILQDVLRRLPYAKDTSDKRNTLHAARAYNMLASISFQKSMYKEARQLIRKAQLSARKIHNQEEEAISLLYLGKYAKRNNIFYLKKSLLIAEKSAEKITVIEIYDELTKFYQKKGNFKIAFEYLKKSNELTKEHISPKISQQLEIIRQKELMTALQETENLRAEAQKMANQDSLTGLYNRRYIDSQLRLLFDTAKNAEDSFVVVLIDIDNFKQINDNYTHSIGDIVLRQIATLLSNGIRSCDLVGRYGGEEFVLVLPNMSCHDAWQMCDRVRDTIAGYDWEEIAENLKVTISAGICGNLSLKNHEKMLQVADENLYRAKNGGKNRIYGHLISSVEFLLIT
jgi:diguanylate cyclase (GGDEF)-like protein